MRIAVIGAGIIGLATAEELLGRGHEVTVFDPDPAGGASLAAAGMLAHAAEMSWGQDALAPLLRASAERYPDVVARLSAASGRSLGYRTDGTLSVGVDAADREALVAAAVLQRAQGLRADLLTGSAARDLEPALGPAVTSAVSTPDDHQIDPRRVTAALLDVLGDRVRRETVTAVTRMGAETTGVRSTSGEQHRADVVVAAAGLDAALIEGVPALPLRPVWGDILRLRAQVRGRGVYLVPREDGTIVVGASVREDGLPGVHAGSVLALLRDVEAVVPGISECEIVEMLARPRPGSPDAVPLLGFVDEGLLVSTGFDRHGVLLAPLAAAVAADLIEGRPIEEDLRSAIDPRRFAVSAAARPREDAAWTPPAVADLVGARPKGSR